MKTLILTLALASQQQLCTVSDGTCIAAPAPQPATETIHPIAHATFTAQAVLTDSCTICGKEPQ